MYTILGKKLQIQYLKHLVQLYDRLVFTGQKATPTPYYTVNLKFLIAIRKQELTFRIKFLLGVNFSVEDTILL